MTNLNGKVAIVTGGGRGIGRVHALALAKEGAAVVVNDLGGDFNGEGVSSDPAQSVVDEIVAAGGRAVANSNDIANWGQAREIIDNAVSVFGRLDVVVNNAGIARFGDIDEISQRDWERTIAVNLTGAAALCHWSAAHWRKTGPEAGRRIINTTSAVGLTPMPNNPMYAASKAGVAALVITCAMELAELGVRVNGIAPVARSRISEFVSKGALSTIPGGWDPLAAQHVSTLLTYLASPRCQFTGRIFGVIGDSITLFDGWTVSQSISNNQQAWTAESLEAALATFPLQQQGATQTLEGAGELRTPSDEVLAALKVTEARP